MTRFFSLFSDSAKEFKSIRSLVITAMLISVSMVLELFTIQIPYAKLNFAFLAIAAIGMLFGPAVGLAAGAICDIVGFVASPMGSFLPAYTLVAMLQGLIYGVVLYRRSMKRLLIAIPIARALDVLIINLCLNTFFNMYYGFIPKQAFHAALWVRLVKNAVELFADIPLLYALLPLLYEVYRRMFSKVRA